MNSTSTTSLTNLPEVESSHVRILVLGDEGVGKTSLISTLVSQHFSEKIPPVMHDVQIPAEENQENVVTTIMDSSSNDPRIADQIKHADAIILVYDIGRPETLARVSSYWLPSIANTKKVPVVLVRNKIDILSINPEQSSNDTSNDHQREVLPILQRFKFVEACMECSAKAVLNIQAAFYFAQKSVIYPIAPLFNMYNSTLQPAFELVLRRVFRLFDADRDGILNDKELNAFQYECFGAHLQPDDIAGLKRVLSEETPDGISPGRGILIKGFLHLNIMFIEKNRPENLWKILRTFGYDKNLEISIPPECIEPPTHEYDQSSELSNSSIRFLHDLFHQFDHDGDGILQDYELEEIFSICTEAPTKFPWNKEDCPIVIGSDNPNLMSLSTWMAQWSLVTLIDVRRTLLYLYYLGYKGTPSTAIDFTKSRRYLHIKEYIPRKVVRCFVLGSPNCGKTSLLQAFLNKPFVPGYTPTKTSRSVSNAVRNSRGGKHPERYLILSEFAETEIKEVVDNVIDSVCDVVCLAYDPCDLDSIEYVRSIQPLLPDHIPCVYVCTKCDAIPEDYAYSDQWKLISEHCASLELSEPMLVSAMKNTKLCGNDSLFDGLVGAAIYPNLARPVSEAKREQLENRKQVQTMATLVASIGFLSVASFMAYKRWR